MNSFYKWLTGISTTIFSSSPTWQPFVNRTCTGSCGACGGNCFFVPILFVWLILVACFLKMKKLCFMVSSNVK